MKHLPSLLLLPAALALVACATPTSTTTAEAPATAQAGEKSLNGPITTGSRLNRGTERAVRVIGSQAFRDENEIRSIGNDVGARSN
ncbi:MAG: hypothetical protein WAQ05_13670 [Rubrivivax sp.]